jgi:hypothetical protein
MSGYKVNLESRVPLDAADDQKENSLAASLPDPARN